MSKSEAIVKIKELQDKRDTVDEGEIPDNIVHILLDLINDQEVREAVNSVYETP